MEDDKVDAEILFQKHNVDELRTILLKIKGDADRKKQDLRTMVGNSYRDVIDAADAVGQMKKSTEELISSFKMIQDICRQTSISSVTNKQDITTPGKVTLYPIAAQIRLLVITPEHIWNATESSNFVTASRYFMIAKLVYANIQSSNESMAAKFKTNFPVVKRQWEAIAPLKAQIVEKALAAIGIKDLKHEKLLDALAAIGILENSTESDLIQIYLKQRKKYLLEKLDIQSVDPTVLQCNLIELTSILKFTFTAIHDLFYTTTESSALKNYLPSIFDSRSDVSMSAFVKLYSENTNMSLLFRYLPASVKKYYPTMNMKSSIDNETLFKLCSQWLDSITTFVNSKLSGLLSKISKGTDLIEIKKDVGSFIWSQKLGNFSNQNTSIESIGHTETPVITEIQRKIHDSAKLIYDDIHSMIVFYKNLTASLKDNSNSKISKDLEQLGVATQRSFEFALDNYTHYLSGLLTELEKEISKSSDPQDLIYSKMIFIGRVSKVVFEISKDLLIMFESKNLLEINQNGVNHSEAHTLAKGLDELYIRSHKLWIGFISTRLNRQSLSKLREINWVTGIQFHSLWEAAENGKSSLPVHPSNFLTEILFDLCKNINKVDGFNMDERSVLLLLNTSFNKIVTAYQEFLDNENNARSKVGDWQLYFDLEFLANTIGQCNTNVADVGERRTLISSLTSIVDKNLSEEEKALIAKNVEKHYQKSIALLNPIFISHIKAQSESGRKATLVQEQHHLVPLAPSVPRFGLLPITTPSHLTSYSKPNLTIPSRSSMKIRSRPESVIKLRTLKSSNSDVPLGVSENSGAGRVMGLMNAVAGLSNISQPQKASDLLTNASSFLSGVWGSSSSPKTNSGRTPK
ncbi:Golgi transport complex subunit 1 [Boothiomyces sp. JEL0866]|nr:Golgi transport complex subunit 1 [Boothiomyces sp. JEL0866]KAJ3320959.1 Golgi transport complex subunit 1 [Boothiomyces sp. JEL0866]